MIPSALTTHATRAGVAACAPLLAKAAFLLVPTVIVGYMFYQLCQEVRWDEFAQQQNS